MKIKKLKNGTVQITLETAEERTMMGNIFNCAPVVDALKEVFPEIVKDDSYDAFERGGCIIQGFTTAIAHALLETHFIKLKTSEKMDSLINRMVVAIRKVQDGRHD